MDGTTILLGVFGVGGCAAAAWLAIGRGRIVAECARERATREGVERERDGMAADVARVEEQLGMAREALTKVSVDRAGLERDIEAERAAHAVTRGRLGEEHGRAMRDLEERLTAAVAHAEEVGRTRLEAAREEKLAIEKKLGEFDKQLREAFGALAADALAKNREQFLALAEQKLEAKRGAVEELVRPIAETLKRTGEKLAVIEQAGTELRSETGKLVRALRVPQVRGRYGEIQLRRVAELAGMSAFCDFAEQEHSPARGADGSALRPDMVVKMPSGRTVVVDAKTNIQAYLDAINAATPAEADACLDKFARHVGDQATALAKKKYWAQYEGSPEFVVMYIPGDQFVDAALTRQPEILERAAEQGVILASPSTLIGLLRAVAVGYAEQRLAKEAMALRELGKELHERVATAMEHAAKVGKSLNASVEAYNDFVGSYERRLEPVMRKFEDGGVKSGKELPEVDAVVVRAREIESEVLWPRADG